MSTVLITGGTGFVGSHLSRFLAQKGYKVIVLSRGRQTGSVNGISYHYWNIDTGEIDPQAISACDHIIHLAGAGMADQRWTAERKKELIRSRVASAELIARSLQQVPNHVSSVIGASAIGWYGPDNNRSRVHGFSEDAPPHDDFLGSTCKAWEDAIASVVNSGKRLVRLRIGIVLSPDGGALKEFAKPLRFGIAPIFSNGSQVASWISMEDLCRMFAFALEQKIEGAFNAVAPQPVTNKELMLTLAQKLRGKAYIPVHVPAVALKLALGELSIEVLKSATVSSRKIQEAGFTFLHPGIKAALDLK